MVSKIHKKLGKASDMSNLHIVRTQVTKTGNVDSLDIVKAALIYSNYSIGGRVLH